jgi:hypothetical protein
MRNSRSGSPPLTIFAYALLALATSSVPDAASKAVPATEIAAVSDTESVSAYDLDGTEFAQLTIKRRVFIRIPSTRIIELPPPERRPRWKEKKGPKCVALDGLGGFAITTPDSIDLFLKEGVRYRAHLENGCPSIAFYSGFYIRPTEDGRICVDRDPIHSRAGGRCGIVAIRKLVPDR